MKCRERTIFMKIQAVDPEEEYQIFCREYKLDNSLIKIGYDAQTLCDHYFRLLLGFSDIRESRRETDCCFCLPTQLDELAAYAIKAGLPLSTRCFLGIHFMESNFPLRNLPERTSALSETEAMLCRDTVDEIRNAVLSLLPSDWKEPRELNTESDVSKTACNAILNSTENNMALIQRNVAVLEYIDAHLGRLPDELLAARVAAYYDLDKRIAMDLCDHIRELKHRN